MFFELDGIPRVVEVKEESKAAAATKKARAAGCLPLVLPLRLLVPRGTARCRPAPPPAAARSPARRRVPPPPPTPHALQASRDKADLADPGSVGAPMAGEVVEVKVGPGRAVKAGEVRTPLGQPACPPLP